MSKQTPPPSLDETLERLRSAGFEIAREGARARVSKDRCAAVLEQDAAGRPVLAQGPGVVLSGEIAGLEDRGFQKYLVTEKMRRPALAEHLHAVHQFSEQMRAALGLVSLYNQSLGSVSDRYLYDRVHGREHS